MSSVLIDGVLYEQRSAEPMHDDFKYQDGAGHWWSPDYYVVVAGGQSNMVGGGSGAPQVVSGNVQAYDWTTGTIVDSRYGPPFSTNADRNNLYLPMANELSAELGRPVLVIARPVSGSVIDSWLESGNGSLWANLTSSVTAALALIGQDHADSFLWLQGETNYPTPVATYQALMAEFISQIRGESWAPDNLAILIGELSREGINATQNQALQALEIAMRDDPYLRFVSSTGLTSPDLDGVHFGGQSLIDLGHRFYEALGEILSGAAPEPNTAPTLRLAPNAPTQITMYEGDTISLSPDLYFTDAEGDRIWLYGAANSRWSYFLDNDDGDLVLHPRYLVAASGESRTYQISVYGSDYALDSARFVITVTVLDRAPGLEVYNTGFSRYYSGYHDFDEAMTEVSRSRGVKLLSQSALDADGTTEVSADNVVIQSANSLTGTFALTGAAARFALTGAARFDVTGNGLDNSITGNDANNLLTGLAGRDRLYGGVGNDELFGGTDQDFLYGDDGNDRLYASSGDDRLYGGEGNDLMDTGVGRDQSYGGGGNDVFVFTSGAQQLRVRDFGDGDDRIQINGFAGISSFAELRDGSVMADYQTSSGFGVKITIGGSVLQIDDIRLDDLYGGLFQFA